MCRSGRLPYSVRSFVRPKLKTVMQTPNEFTVANMELDMCDTNMVNCLNLRTNDFLMESGGELLFRDECALCWILIYSFAEKMFECSQQKSCSFEQNVKRNGVLSKVKVPVPTCQKL